MRKTTLLLSLLCSIGFSTVAVMHASAGMLAEPTASAAAEVPASIEVSGRVENLLGSGASILPGWHAERSVAVQNKSQTRARLTLRAPITAAKPGLGGGHLEQELMVTIRDADSGEVLRHDSLAGLALVDLGELAPQQTRHLRVSVRLGDVDNRFQGAVIAADLTWNLQG